MKLSHIEGYNSLKACVLDEDLPKQYNKARKRAFQGDRSDLDELEGIYPSELLQVARNIVSSQNQRYKRAFDRTSEYIKAGEGVFLTFTFTDKALTTDEKTRRVYVSRTLRDLSREYIANIDYGTKSEREHYHAIFRLRGCRLKSKIVKVSVDGKTKRYLEAFYQPVCCDENSDDWLPVSSLPALARWQENYGFIYCKVVATTDNDAKASSRYVSKSLTAHALKKSTKKDKVSAPRLIYSRKNRKV